MKRKAAIILMVSGILLIGFALGLLIYNNAENKKAEENSYKIMESIRKSIEENELKGTVTDPFDVEMKIKEIDGYGYIGYVSIPDIEIDLPVMSEWDYERLKISPCRYYGSTKTDNLVIAGHNYNSHFKYLDRLKPGSSVFFKDMEGNIHKYKVNTVELLLPTDVDKVKNSGDDLILYTCTYSRAERITVRCSYAETD